MKLSELIEKLQECGKHFSSDPDVEITGAYGSRTQWISDIVAEGEKCVIDTDLCSG